MAMTSIQLDHIAACLADSTQLSAGIAAARSRYPGLSFTCCDASDMCDAVPYQVFAAFDLYLVDGNAHCWQVSGDPQVATGVLIARHD